MSEEHGGPGGPERPIPPTGGPPPGSGGAPQPTGPASAEQHRPPGTAPGGSPLAPGPTQGRAAQGPPRQGPQGPALTAPHPGGEPRPPGPPREQNAGRFGGAPPDGPPPPIGQPAPARPGGRRIPLWAALACMLAAALVAGVAGGAVGVLATGPARQEVVPEQEGPANNEPPPEAPPRDPDTIAGVAQRVGPSVVSISSAGRTVLTSGSGFVIDGNYVVTNDHVSSELEADGILVEYSDGNLSTAEVVGADPSSDLAVLSLDEPVEVEPLQFGDSEQVVVGDEVIAIGAPLGYTGTVTQGIISAVNRPVTSGEGPDASRFYALQTDAAINPGNSGGPLVDTQGRVIGVNSMIVTMGYMGEAAGNIGLGFAIPSVEAERVVRRLIENGETTYADIGADIDLDSPIAGAVVAEGTGAVEPGGPADEAGLRSGDVIVSFAGNRVHSGQEFLAMLRDRMPGDEVGLRYERDGEPRETSIVLGSTSD
ncbi:S1C family serine protease [Nocardiopsis algeriensis]|uniref:Putative serine protease PepD n=1 Tax=Nocardiopsis algeriensis TaxID=1478215 RepID=A0A841IQF2_9ACTN|nr:trypsin-like peptidase domain-containing protein [Nocardiopsis algeriensis]MBB6118875.1 putative serine protease PepD [Nocardiopsis algeriensis]